MKVKTFMAIVFLASYVVMAYYFIRLAPTWAVAGFTALMSIYFFNKVIDGLGKCKTEREEKR